MSNLLTVEEKETLRKNFLKTAATNLRSWEVAHQFLEYREVPIDQVIVSTEELLFYRKNLINLVGYCNFHSITKKQAKEWYYALKKDFVLKINEDCRRDNETHFMCLLLDKFQDKEEIDEVTLQFGQVLDRMSGKTEKRCTVIRSFAWSFLDFPKLYEYVKTRLEKATILELCIRGSEEDLKKVPLRSWAIKKMIEDSLDYKSLKQELGEIQYRLLEKKYRKVE